MEINSSFYREHQGKTYARWAQNVPDDFRFSVKLSKQFIHDCQLRAEPKALKESISNILMLGSKLEVLLVQLPPSLAFDNKVTEKFFSLIRKYYSGHICVEPRHLSWMDNDSQKLWEEYGISKVLADPERCPGEFPSKLQYHRLHGSPEIYKSEYSQKFLEKLSLSPGSWCIFDNSTFGFATKNALQLRDLGRCAQGS